MSNSSLATYVDLSSYKWNYRTQPISRITIHHAAGVVTHTGLSGILANPDRQASWNYGIASDGSIGLYVEESNRAWTSSSEYNDQRAVTIEVSNSATTDDWPVSDVVYQSLINLCIDICRRNNIPKLVFTGDEATSNLTMHKWFAPTACPGPYLEPRFPDIANKVNEALGSTNLDLPFPQIMSPTAYQSAIFGTTSAENRLLIDSAKLTPYVATIDRNVPSVDISKLKTAGVVGLLIEAGCLYDIIHIKQTYRNKYLKQQVNSASAKGMPFGLYTVVRARSVEEAQLEINELRYCLYQYPPLLGVWLKIEFVKSKSTNHQILDLYYKRLTELGFKDRVGIKATTAQLQQIDWDNYCDKFYLWWEDNVPSVVNLSDAITPQFFVVSGG